MGPSFRNHRAGGIVKRWAIILAVFLGLVVVAVASIPLFINANTLRPVIERQLTTMLGRNVRLGDLRMSLLSGELIATDLSVADDPSFSVTPFLTAGELRIGVSLRLLIFSRQLNLHNFQFETPQINVIRGENGTWYFSSMGPVAPLANAASGILNGSVLKLADLPIGRVVIKDGRALIASSPSHG